ncbi:MAG: hypothetical protein QM640_03530 [Niabella sp.]
MKSIFKNTGLLLMALFVLISISSCYVWERPYGYGYHRHHPHDHFDYGRHGNRRWGGGPYNY